MSRQRGSSGSSGKYRITKAQAAKLKGIPNRRPSASQRMLAIMAGKEWDVNARQEREAVQPYRGSREEANHRAGREVPTARNGSRSPEAKRWNKR